MNKEIRNKNNSDRIEFYLNTVAKFCDKCGNKYTDKNLKIIQENNQSSIIHFNCPKCKSRHVATFISSLGLSSRTSINSDLSVDEISLYSMKNEIQIDEVLDVNESLKKDSKVTV